MKPLFTGLLALLFFAAYAQDGWQLVYYKGDVKKAGTKANYLPLTVVGTQLTNTETVKVGEKSEAIFANGKKQVVRLTQPGNVAVKDFGKMVIQETSQNFGAYYLKYVAGELTHKKESVEADYKSNMKNLGGVSRGNYANCLIMPFNGTAIKNNNVTFCWKKAGPASYVVTIYEDSALSKQVFTTTVKDTFAVINLTTAGLHGNQTYWWTVGGRGIVPCNIFSFNNLPGKHVADIENEFQKLADNLAYSPGMNKAIEGRFWEEKGLFDQAYQAYTEACSLEPGNATFTQLKAAFEERMGGM